MSRPNAHEHRQPPHLTTNIVTTYTDYVRGHTQLRDQMLLRRPHDLAALLRDGRARAGWSQTELAEKVGVSRQWVSLVETGKTSVEFDLVVGALQELDYRMYVESSDQTKTTDARQTYDVEIPTHGPSGRTQLTMHGEPLGHQRTRRRPHNPDRTDRTERTP